MNQIESIIGVDSGSAINFLCSIFIKGTQPFDFTKPNVI